MSFINNLFYFQLDEIDFELTPSACFTQANGEKISYIEYYKTHYNLKIEDPKQPLLIHNVNLSNTPQWPKDETLIVFQLNYSVI